MSAADEFIKRLEKSLPDPVFTHDLINVGIYNNAQAASYGRKVRTGPEFFRAGRKVFYSKESVIEWLKACKNGGEGVETT
jgi:hypothetical protein